MTEEEIREMARALATATGIPADQAAQSIRQAIDNPPTPAQFADAALTMRLNGRLAGRIFVPRRPVKRSVKR